MGSTKRMGLSFWDKKDFERCIFLESTRELGVERRGI